MSHPLTALVTDHHRLLNGLLIGIDPTHSGADHDGSPLLVLIQMAQHNVHEATVLLPLIEQERPGGSAGRSIAEGIARLDDCLVELEKHRVGSPEFAGAVAELRRVFGKHAAEVEAALPEVDERSGPDVVNTMRHLLGPTAAESARLPDQVRREFAVPDWPRPGLTRTLRGMFETRLRQQTPASR